MDTLLRDLRYSVRSLMKQPTFAVVAVVTLALGIGGNTVIFSVVNALILSPPSIVEPERMVAIWSTPSDKQQEGPTSYPNYQDWKARNRSFEDIAAYKSNSPTLLTNGVAERIPGMRVTANFLPVLNVTLLKGRNFQPEEEQKGAFPVAIISYEFWQTRFGGAESILSRQITLNSKTHSIIGVLRPGFQFPLIGKEIAVLTTVSGEGGNLPERGANILAVLGRLKRGVTLDQARADMAAVAAQLEQAYPGPNKKKTTNLVSVHEQIVGREVRKALWLLLGAVAFILLIACTNTANLMLVRASARQKEISIRAALGAGNWRIARQLMTESLLISLVAGAIALMISVWGLGAIRFYAAGQLPRLEEVRVDSRVLLFTFAISVFTGLLFGLLPALKASRPDVNEVLKATTKSTPTRSLRYWRDSLVVLEVALSLILLVGAGLMIRSFARLVTVPPGFDSNNVLTAQIHLTRDVYENPEACIAYMNQTLAQLRALPGVEGAAFVAPMPFSGGNVGSDFRIEGRPIPEPGAAPLAANRSVTNEYFQTMRIPLLRGRYFNDQDRRGSVGAAIINQALAEKYFANEDPIGQRVSHIGANQNDGDPEQWEIVGVVGDVHHSNLKKAASAELYLPYQQNSWSWGNFLVRTSSDPSSLKLRFQQTIRDSDKTAPITDVRTLNEAISETVAESRFYTFLFGLFGLLGLVLTMTGVYGLISYTVTQRTQEIGIRMALGATRQNVMHLVLRHGAALTVVGAAVGIGISLVLTSLIVSLLFEVKPTDAATFATATFVLLFSATLASYLPARRATKVDPLIALRYE